MDAQLGRAPQLELSFQHLQVAIRPPHQCLHRVVDLPVEGKNAARAPEAGRVVIRNMSGTIPAGSLVAIMGASGAGKTTLLNLLSNRLVTTGAPCTPGLSASGQISVNGHAVGPSFFSQYCAYVPQASILLTTLSPRESVFFSASMRMAGATSEAKRLRTDQVIRQLELQRCADTRIGDELVRGVSGGEKRRTSIAVELVTNPRILFIDGAVCVRGLGLKKPFVCAEPTTGLDSHTAAAVMRTIKQLTIPDEGSSRQSVTVVCSIHQPSHEIFELFDHLLLLAGGEIVYCGPARLALAHFAQLGMHCPPMTNPAEFFLELLQEPNKMVGGASTMAKPAAAVAVVDGGGAPATRLRVPFPQQTASLTHRSWLTFYRTPMLIPSKMLQICNASFAAAHISTVRVQLRWVP